MYASVCVFVCFGWEAKKKKKMTSINEVHETEVVFSHDPLNFECRLQTSRKKHVHLVACLRPPDAAKQWFKQIWVVVVSDLFRAGTLCPDLSLSLSLSLAVSTAAASAPGGGGGGVVVRETTPLYRCINCHSGGMYTIYEGCTQYHSYYYLEKKQKN